MPVRVAGIVLSLFVALPCLGAAFKSFDERPIDRALQWLTSATNGGQSDLASHFLLFEFASNLAGGSTRHSEIVAVLRRRGEFVVPPREADACVSPAAWFDCTIAAHITRTGRKEYAALLTETWKRHTAEDLMPVVGRPAYSADHVNRLMLTCLLLQMGVASSAQFNTLLESDRKGYSRSSRADDLEERKRLYYYASHVIFALSLLGKHRVPAGRVQPELALLREAVRTPSVRRDNDLWPEVYIALSLTEGCQSSERRSHLQDLARSQVRDGSWAPSVLPESFRLHTTSVIFLAALADGNCTK